MALPLPVLLSSRPVAHRVVAAAVVPVVFGALTGVVLGWSAGAYVALLVVAFLGGFGAGLEHDAPREGLLRGVAGGLLFTGSLLVAHAVAGTGAEVELPDPPPLLLVLNSLIAAVTGVAGAVLRRRVAAAAVTAP